MKIKLLMGLVLLCGIFSFSSVSASDFVSETDFASVPALNEYQEGALYVRFKSTRAPKCAEGQRKVAAKSASALNSLRGEYAFRPEMESMRLFNDDALSRTYLVRFENIGETEALIAELLENPDVEMVERVPAYRIAAGEETKDPFYGVVEGTNFSWHLDMINAEKAWAMQSGRAEVVVAVVDNAVWGEHPDLQIPSSRQYNILSDETGNSSPSNVKQNETCDNLSTCDSYNWSHGTHCAGLIGAINNNGVGIRSIGSGVSVMGVAVPAANSDGLHLGNTFGGVSYAAEHGAKVLSLSWGSYSISETERAIIQGCIDKGIVVVAAAGNNSSSAPFYPACLPGVISVGSVNSDKGISSFSNYGDWVTIAAPGGFIANNGNEGGICIFSTTFCQSQSYRMLGVSSTTGQYYDGMYGTSMATPLVSGLVGLLLSADTSMDSYMVREVLISGAQEIKETANRNFLSNTGIVDAEASLKIVKEHKPMPQNFSVKREQDRIVLKWDAPKTDETLVGYRIFRNNELFAETTELSFIDTVETVSNLYRYGVAAVYEGEAVSLRASRDILVPSLYLVETDVRPEGCGTVEGAGYYPGGETATLVAKAEKGCTFTRWLENGKTLGRDTALDYVVSYEKTTIEAVFSGTPEPTATEGFARETELRIFPNPASEILTIEADVPLYSVELFSTSGTSVLRRDFGGAGVMRLEIGVAGLADGVYVVKAFGKNGVTVGKVLKI